ncbi:hypothetical protein D9M68_810700 [compost metagenome]
MRRPGKTFLGQQCGQDSIARRITNTKALGGTTQGFHQPRGLSTGISQRPGQLTRIKAKELANSHGRPENTTGGRDVPTALVMPRMHRHTQPTLHLDSQDQCQKKLLSGYRRAFGMGKERSRNRRRWVNDGRDMGVVEIVHIGAHRIERSDIQHVHSLGPTDHALLATGPQLPQ